MREQAVPLAALLGTCDNQDALTVAAAPSKVESSPIGGARDNS
jgi:hypothetical protein